MNLHKRFLEELKKIETWISLAGVTVAVVIFVCWICNTEDISVPGGIAAALSLVMFLGVCLRFVPAWTGFWRKNISDINNIETDIEINKRDINITALKIFFVFNAVCFFIIIFVYAIRSALYGVQPFGESLEFWKCLDSGHYLDIAEDWYLSTGEWDRLVQLVFLPGYPFIIKIFNVLFDNYLYASLAASSMFFGAAGAVFYKLMRLDYDKQTSLRAIKYLCLIPGVFFFAAPMSESLFLFCSVSCIYFARKRRWLAAGLLGGYAALTRSLGIVLLVPLIFEFVSYLINKEYLKDTDAKKRYTKAVMALRAASILLIPAGFGVYCYINYRVSGDPFKFLYYQKEHWGQEFGLFFNTASYQTDRMISEFSDKFNLMLGLWLPNLISSFSALLTLFVTVKRIRPSYVAYAIAYFFVAIGATWLLSAPRYLAALFILPMGFAVITNKPKWDMTLTVVCTVASVFYLFAFVMRWQVW
ncbi:MAG: glycosyltransferase family 39 protein [Clostridia bacterium]|nr:glycosyltransferase family 39 protein [Clostridia bacterium]